MDVLQNFIFTRTYSRYLYEEGRREYWEETVDRYCDFMFKNQLIPDKVKKKCKSNILNFNVMPSMRALWAAGEAARRDNATIYNCSALLIDEIGAFGETLYLLMAGAGVGYSCERKNVDKLPPIKKQRNVPIEKWIVRDSREGWKEALDKGVELWFDGRDIFFDYSQLRPMGAPLKTMGGRSSGGDVLRQLMGFAKETIIAAQGRKLTPLEAHDIMCEIASVVVVGGVRRSALISLSDLDDEDMRTCKNGKIHPRRWGANNSAVYYDKPDMLEFLHEWIALAGSGRGERGIANLWAARRNAPHRRKSKLIQLFNPCGEVTLRSKQCCNLTEVVIRPEDDFESLRDKITSAVWLGVLQAMNTDFPFLSKEWKENCDEERLLGVSLTGQLDNPSLLTEEVLRLSKQHAINVAKKASKIMGINMPAAIGSVKPSGTVSQLTNSSAGLHPRWSKYYKRNMQIAKMDPLFKMMADEGVPWIDTPGADHTAIVSFPVESPKNAITRHDMSAIDQLEWYKKIVSNWTEHNASATCYVAKDEWLSVGAWVYDNFDKVTGITFLPKEQPDYLWTPFEEIDEKEYVKLKKEFPKIDFGKLSQYENDDMTEGAKSLACSGGSCDI